MLHKYADAEAVAQAAAKFIADRITDVLKQQDRFTLALSGGSTPKRLHQILAASPYKEQIDWNKLHIFWGDERYVPFEDERNNAKMAFDTLLDHVPVPKEQIHIMRSDIDPRESAEAYEKILHHYFDGKQHSFDLVILGMGDDGHTLSLFPGTEVIYETEKWCTAFFLKQQDMFRITLTRTIANNASCILFLTTGTAKAPALKQVLQGEPNPTIYPSQVINAAHGETIWMVDQAAASLLDG
nr:6-phosphogluconolactonase [Flavihumibacter rivuli]